MKKLNYLFGLLFMAGAAMAQPCSKFEGPAPAAQGNWQNIYAGVSYGTNPIDGSQCITLHDQSGGSTFENPVDFVKLGKKWEHYCLCFDYNVANDGVAGSSVPIKPTIYVTNGSQYIYFEASTTIYEGSTWVHVCAPIEFCTGGPLPSNADGQWKMPAGYTCTDFNNILGNSQKLVFFVDVAGSSYQTEQLSFDNICVQRCNDEQPLPCSRFNDQMAGNWTTQFSTLSWGTNPLDGSPCATVDDGSGPSYFLNTVDYDNLATNFLHKCLCFDYNVTDDGVSGSSVPINPRIYLSFGGLSAWFEAYATVTEGSSWVHVCAPIELSSGGVLPSNTDGQWMMPAGQTAADFDAVLLNCQQVLFVVDVAGSSAIAETIQVDNICVEECSSPIRCNSGFRIETGFNTDPTSYPTPPSYVANVFLNYNNPGSTYTVDWGDGTITSPFVSHVYAGPGSYVICVTEYQERVAVCKTCMSFCFGQAYDVFLGHGENPGGGHPTGGDAGKKAAPAPASSISMGMFPADFHENDYMIYPNPSKDFADLRMSLSKKDKVTIRVIDLYGKVMSEVAEKGYDAGTQNIRINTVNMPSGVYTVQIIVGDKVSSVKLSVMK